MVSCSGDEGGKEMSNVLLFSFLAGALYWHMLNLMSLYQHVFNPDAELQMFTKVLEGGPGGHGDYSETSTKLNFPLHGIYCTLLALLYLTLRISRICG